VWCYVKSGIKVELKDSKGDPVFWATLLKATLSLCQDEHGIYHLVRETLSTHTE